MNAAQPRCTAEPGLGFERLAALNRQLVYCSVSACGHSRPDAHRAAVGLTDAARAAIDVPAAKVQRIAEVPADPQIAARGMVVAHEHPKVGTICLAHLPCHFSASDSTIRSVARSIGQHNREVAAGLGWAPGDIDALLQDGVLYTP